MKIGYLEAKKRSDFEYQIENIPTDSIYAVIVR